MSREIIRVEPLSSYLERYKAPASVMTRHGNTLYVSGLPPFDPATGEIVKAPIERIPGALRAWLQQTKCPPRRTTHVPCQPHRAATHWRG